MMATVKYNWKKILVQTLWVLSGIGTIILFGAAMQKKNQKLCADIKIEITGVERHMFIDEKDVLDILNSAGPVAGNALSAINLKAMETVVERNPWVKNAEMFLDNNQVLEVRIEERQPVARVFTLEGSSFYLDSGAMRLPVSEKLSARVPLFTSFPSERQVLSRPDSALLRSIVKLGGYILADSFWMAQVAQVDITAKANFELVPVIGDHIIVLGNTDQLDKKFRRLYTFYQKAWLQSGINTYEKLDVQYDNQVVAVRKGTTKAWVDSLKSSEIMKTLIAGAGLKDSSLLPSMGKENLAKAVKDSMKVSRAFVKPLVSHGKTNSAVSKNNKAGTKTLSKGKKSVPVQNKSIKPKPAGKVNKPKAVMEKNQ